MDARFAVLQQCQGHSSAAVSEVSTKAGETIRKELFSKVQGSKMHALKMTTWVPLIKRIVLAKVNYKVQ